MAARKVKNTAPMRPEARQLRDTRGSPVRASAKGPLKVKGDALDGRLRCIRNEKKHSLVEVLG